MPRYGDRDCAGLPAIKVVGVGGAGCRIIRRLMALGVPGAELVVVDADWACVRATDAHRKVELEGGGLRGLGSGGQADWANRAAEACAEQLAAAVAADIVFIVAGMGGGTSGGATPVVARIARSLGALTAGVVTMPLALERERRAAVAREGLAALAPQVDSLIVIPGDGVLATVDPHRTTITQLYETIDAAVCDVLLALVETLLVPGYFGLDPAEVAALLTYGATVTVGIGRASGAGAAVDAARLAVESPLLQAPVGEARHVLARIRGGERMTVGEIADAGEVLRRALKENALLTVQAHCSAAEQEGVSVVLFATGRPAGLP